MPRRKGIAGRLWDAVKRVVIPGKAREQPPPIPTPPPEPPSVPPEDGGGVDTGSDTLDGQLYAQYVRVTGTATGYLDWRDLYEGITIAFDDDSERVMFFGEFLRAYYLTTSEPGHITRRKFHQDTGVPQRTKTWMDWDAWREMRRGTP